MNKCKMCGTPIENNYDLCLDCALINKRMGVKPARFFVHFDDTTWRALQVLLTNAALDQKDASETCYTLKEKLQAAAALIGAGGGCGVKAWENALEFVPTSAAGFDAINTAADSAPGNKTDDFTRAVGEAVENATGVNPGMIQIVRA